MTHEEFNKLMGEEMTQEEYVRANAMYLLTDLDKQSFCNRYKCIGHSDLVEALYNKCSLFEERSEKINDMFKKERKRVLVAAHYLINVCRGSEVPSNLIEKFDDVATTMIGLSKVIMYKLKHKYPLSAGDLEYIYENLM